MGGAAAISPPATRTGSSPLWWYSGAAAFSGVAIALTFPPVGWWWLAPVAYAPLLLVWRRSSPGQSALLGLISGTLATGITCSWMWYFGAVAFVPFILAMGTFPALVGYVLALIRPLGIRGPWIEAAVWIAAEGLLARFPFGGMPWMAAGTQLAPFTPARALAPWGGVLLAGFGLIALNGLVLDVLRSLHSRRLPELLLAGSGIVALTCVCLAAVLAWPRTPTAGPLRYALLQGNDLNRQLTSTEIDTNYLRESHFGLATELNGRYDLIVFPESALLGEDPESDILLRQRVIGLAQRYRSWVMVNVNEVVGDATYNTNRVYDPSGELVASYRKQHLVPFGEYLPFRWVRTIAPAVEQIGSGFESGSGNVTVPVAGHPLTTVICFENAFAPLVRDAVNQGAQGIVLSTNNRSYRRSGNSAQHIQLTQWRAAELGRPIVHAAISGISASVDANGRVQQRTRLFERTVLTGTFEARTGSTPYARWGDWVTLACALLTLGAVLAAVVGVGARAGRKAA